MHEFSAFMDNRHHGTLINATNILKISLTNLLNVLVS